MESQRKSQVDSQSKSSYQVTADYYDLIYEDVAPDDLAFYLELAGSLPGPVLELGCGTGRVTLELARAGHRVIALDNADSMLSKLHGKLALENAKTRKLVDVVKCSMVDFEIGKQFGLVIAPFRGFQHILDPLSQQECLRNIAKHLQDDGCFVFNAFEPSLEYIFNAMEQGQAFQLVNEAADEKGGVVVRRYHQNAYDTTNQIITVNWKYEVCDLYGKLVETRFEEMKLRWTYRWEADYLLKLCGFDVIERYGDFEKNSLGDKAKELVYVCRKAKEQ